VLRETYEEPDRAGAEIREQVLRSPEGAALNRLIKMNDQEYRQTYESFLRGRRESRKTGRAPGDPIADVHTPEASEGVVPEAPDGAAAAAARHQTAAAADKRRHAADTLAPGAANGIGAAIFHGDALRYAVIKDHTVPADEAESPDEATNDEPDGWE